MSPRPLNAKGFLVVLAPTPFIKELPMKEAVGAPAGVLLAWEDGGGPAGVFDSVLLPKSKRPLVLP